MPTVQKLIDALESAPKDAVVRIKESDTKTEMIVRVYDEDENILWINQ